MKTNTTALEAVLTARDEDVRDVKSLDFFSFVYNGIEVAYHGRHYGYASPVGSGYHDEEFGAWTFEEMLDCKLDLTGRTRGRAGGHGELPPVHGAGGALREDLREALQTLTRPQTAKKAPPMGGGGATRGI